MTRREAFEFLKGVQNEFTAARFSVAATDRLAQIDPTSLPLDPDSVKPSHLRDCLTNLEMTYVLRLFAEFEFVLRDFWNVMRPRQRGRRRTHMELLIDRIATLLSIPAGIVSAAQRVRDYRNARVHRADIVQELTFRDCKSILGHFLSFLPIRW